MPYGARGGPGGIMPGGGINPGGGPGGNPAIGGIGNPAGGKEGGGPLSAGFWKWKEFQYVVKVYIILDSSNYDTLLLLEPIYSIISNVFLYKITKRQRHALSLKINKK